MGREARSGGSRAFAAAVQRIAPAQCPGLSDAARWGTRRFGYEPSGCFTRQTRGGLILTFHLDQSLGALQSKHNMAVGYGVRPREEMH